MADDEIVTCQIRYKLDLSKLDKFEAYARMWMRLIERHGGTHHGYFMPRALTSGVRMSFPGVGREGPSDIAVALFTFPNEASYRRYRETVATDPDCQSAEALYRDTLCFFSYERLFLRPMAR